MEGEAASTGWNGRPRQAPARCSPPKQLVLSAANAAAGRLGLEEVYDDSPQLPQLLAAVADRFQISRQAAEVRLRELRVIRPAAERRQGRLGLHGLLTSHPSAHPLFCGRADE